MHDPNYADEKISRILKNVGSIALVGASENPARPSYIVFKYLKERGYRVIPINPGLAGRQLLGEPICASLEDVPEPIDMVEIFRNSAAAGPIVGEVLQLAPLPRYVWMQLGVVNADAAARAEAAGIEVIMNRCPKIEYGRLSGEIGWQGISTGILSAKKPLLSKRGVQKLTLG
jgi:hypothetical protein